MEIIFQQDGVPSRFYPLFRGYLEQLYLDGWIGRRGSIEFLVMSLDLAPLDFFICYLKQTVNATQPETIEKLRKNSGTKLANFR